jgi:hypothetical protein
MPRRNGKAKETPEKFLKRQKVWRHNGFLGGVSMARKSMLAIMNSTTATRRAKQQANMVLALLNDLYPMLKERVDV